MNSGSPAVIVLRASPAGSELVRAVEALPLPVTVATIYSPMYRVADVDPAGLRREFDAAGPFDAMILTSPHAAKVALRVLGPETLTPLFRVAPGAGTGAALEAAGLPVCRPGLGGTSEDILALPELAPDRVHGRRFAILAAPGGRTLLRKVLAERGARVEMIKAYQRVALTPATELLDALDRQQSLITMVSSRAALDRLIEQLGPAPRLRHWLTQRFIVSSKRLGRVLRDHGAIDVATAHGAADVHMVRALERMCAPRAP